MTGDQIKWQVWCWQQLPDSKEQETLGKNTSCICLHRATIKLSMLKLFSNTYDEELKGEKISTLFPATYPITFSYGMLRYYWKNTQYQILTLRIWFPNWVGRLNYLMCFSQAGNILWTTLKMSSLFKGSSAYVLKDQELNIKDVAKRPRDDTTFYIATCALHNKEFAA